MSFSFAINTLYFNEPHLKCFKFNSEKKKLLPTHLMRQKIIGITYFYQHTGLIVGTVT